MAQRSRRNRRQSDQGRGLPSHSLQWSARVMGHLSKSRSPNRVPQMLLFRGNSKALVPPFWTMVNPPIQGTCARSFACPGATTGRGSDMTAHIRRECRLGSDDDLEQQAARPVEAPGITASKPRNRGFQRCVTASISARLTWEHSSSAPWRTPPETGARSSETLEATNAWTLDGQVLEVSDLRTYFVPPPSRARRRQLRSRRRAARGPRRSRGRRHNRSRCGRGSSSR